MAHRYQLTLRPLGIGCLPRGYNPFSAVGCDQPPTQYNFGSVSYPYQLDDEQVQHFDLKYLGVDVSKCCGAATTPSGKQNNAGGIPAHEICATCGLTCDTVPGSPPVEGAPKPKSGYEQIQMIDAVRKEARLKYEQGWDVVVECWDDADILEATKDAGTIEEGLAEVGRVMALLSERRQEIEAEIF